CFRAVVDLCQRTIRPVGIHTYPLVFCHSRPRKKDLAMPFELVSVKSEHARQQPRHKSRIQTQPKQSAKKHYLNVVIYRRSIVDHYCERAAGFEHPTYFFSDLFGQRRMMDDAKAVNVVKHTVGKRQGLRVANGKTRALSVEFKLLLSESRRGVCEVNADVVRAGSLKLQPVGSDTRADLEN